MINQVKLDYKIDAFKTVILTNAWEIKQLNLRMITFSFKCKILKTNKVKNTINYIYNKKINIFKILAINNKIFKIISPKCMKILIRGI